MKAIYNKPLTDIVTLNIQDVLAYDEAHPSNPYKTADGNTGFFSDEPNNNGTNTFFED